MDKELLTNHIKAYVSRIQRDENLFAEDFKERSTKISYYSSWNRDKFLKMSEDDLYEFMSKLWALRMWGNKRYVVDNVLQQNDGIAVVREQLASLVWDEEDIVDRWNRFRNDCTGFGPSMMSEILCLVHPNEYFILNKPALSSLKFLGVPSIPKYDYQKDGKNYKTLLTSVKIIKEALEEEFQHNVDYVGVDYFIWELYTTELQSIQFDSQLPELKDEGGKDEVSKFIHNEIQDKIAQIGTWLGFQVDKEQYILPGSRVDVVWEAVIGNMGRVIYVFEVQTKGSVDSLSMNLIKATNNLAVQAVVAVSDSKQLDQIKKNVSNIDQLRNKLKYWNYEEVLTVHENLELGHSLINQLGLVPEGFKNSN